MILTTLLSRAAPKLHQRLAIHPKFSHFDRAVTVMVFFDLFPRFWATVIEMTVVVSTWAHTFKIPTKGA